MKERDESVVVQGRFDDDVGSVHCVVRVVGDRDDGNALQCGVLAECVQRDTTVDPRIFESSTTASGHDSRANTRADSAFAATTTS